MQEPESLKVKRIVDSINLWMKIVREDVGIADISDAVAEYSESIREAGLTEQKVYAAFRQQFQ